MRTLITTVTLALTLVVSGCAGLTPETFTRAVVAHQAFPSLSLAVQECVADHTVRAQIVEPFNVLVDKWQAASELKPDEELLQVLVNAKTDVLEAQTAWTTIRSALEDAQIDCGAWVRQQADSVELTFGEIKSALLSSERLVLAGEYALLVSRVVLGADARVRRMDDGAQ